MSHDDKEISDLQFKIKGLTLALENVIQAIENGQLTKDHRGIIYTQSFGESFLRMLKIILR